MLNQKKALLLIGSPKKRDSTSAALGNYLLNSLYQKGFIIEELHILSILKTDLQKLLNRVNDCDILILSFPLYVDSLPSPVIRALEAIDADRKKKQIHRKQAMMTIINCGFPETFHNDTALKICKSFAHETHFKWLGGLAMGGGGAISGRAIEQLGGMTRNITRALDMAAEAVMKDAPIPAEALELMSRKLLPIGLYTLVGHIGWKSQAKKNNAKKKLYARPYQEGK
ncbi:NAD(P)H-dependent oxidoreductase [Geosporobacter ferrireducens]|uniref:NADPH-dependent FMN reductase-like domain-containing protein n=1 Tax=Geosporobacter ferrireducens TaxID=1424294 RepID=A0A1D8GFD6_9FIRM|nr:NAD(P)H-dependent oxidoreductase [Geosporobacter ferrireducens]AOT69615.1 hypothetical protein Gferi_08515 [Geosporobacter ferrireducens]MTI54683.1 NAD(P)H-dependent oxidoreductase [Geosporobacter ferrireducens]